MKTKPTYHATHNGSFGCGHKHKSPEAAAKCGRTKYKQHTATNVWWVEDSDGWKFPASQKQEDIDLAFRNKGDEYGIEVSERNTLAEIPVSIGHDTKLIERVGKAWLDDKAKGLLVRSYQGLLYVSYYVATTTETHEPTKVMVRFSATNNDGRIIVSGKEHWG